MGEGFGRRDGIIDDRSGDYDGIVRLSLVKPRTVALNK